MASDQPVWPQRILRGAADGGDDASALAALGGGDEAIDGAQHRAARAPAPAV